MCGTYSCSFYNMLIRASVHVHKLFGIYTGLSKPRNSFRGNLIDLFGMDGNLIIVPLTWCLVHISIYYIAIFSSIDAVATVSDFHFDVPSIFHSRSCSRMFNNFSCVGEKFVNSLKLSVQTALVSTIHFSHDYNFHAFNSSDFCGPKKLI